MKVFSTHEYKRFGSSTRLTPNDFADYEVKFTSWPAISEGVKEFVPDDLCRNIIRDTITTFRNPKNPMTVSLFCSSLDSSYVSFVWVILLLFFFVDFKHK